MDYLLFLEILQHSHKKPRTIRPRKDLFDHFDDEEFNKRFRSTKSTVTKLLEQVGIPADCAGPQCFIFLSKFVYFTLLCVCVCIRLIGPMYVVVLFIWLFAMFTVMLLGWSSRLSMWIKLILSYYSISVPVSVRLQPYNNVTNYAIGLGQGHASL